MDLVTVDLGGTHVRFAIARVDRRRIALISKVTTLETARFATFGAAWSHFAAAEAAPLPRAAAIAVACPVNSKTIKMTNNPWVIHSEELRRDLQLDALTLVNDFGAVGHAVAHLNAPDFQHIAGPDVPLPDHGVISVIGPGTGLGVAQVLRRNGQAHVIETEGGHSDFAPLDDVEDAILAWLRSRYGRVSVERIVSGPGLLNIYEALAALHERPVKYHDDKTLWAAAMTGQDALASQALTRFCLAFGAVAGDVALTQGAAAVVIAGGIAPRIISHPALADFAERFTAKGRFQHMMAALPVKLISHSHVGLIGAAAAFAQEHQVI